MKTALSQQSDEFKSAYNQMYGGIIKLIEEERVRRDITQEQLGELTGLCQPAVARIMKEGYCPRFDTLYKICIALNIDIFAVKQ